VDKPEPVGPYVRFSSIRGFKGLESAVVVLCELEDLDEDTRDQQLYVGMSRAKNHCVVVVPKRRG
jgi:superfamily I DNA/RNA helicase